MYNQANRGTSGYCPSECNVRLLQLLGLTKTAASVLHLPLMGCLPPLQAVHTLEDVGDSELNALAGGEILRTVKIINKEVRATSKAAKAGCERLRDALITVSTVLLYAT